MTAFEFQSLTSVENADLDGYREAFEYAFGDLKIRNIALTGSYGSGKSSVLESYEKELKREGGQLRFMHISLAKFEQVNAENQDLKDLSNKDKRNVEGKILNQLVHQLSREAIRKSPINMSVAPDGKRLFRWVAFICMFLLSILYFCTLSFQRTFLFSWDYLNCILDERGNAALFLIMLTVFVGSFIFIAGYLIQKQMKYRILRKIIIRNNVIDLFPEDKKGSEFYFDRYMNEICSLFLDSEFDIFVFEDLDRYDSSYVFQKLRELNGLIHIKNLQRYERDRNASAINKWWRKHFLEKNTVEHFKPIRFIYLVRDDIFMQTDRTKFFDFIIPVVPIISGHNAYTEVVSTLDADIVSEETAFIKQITLYVTDMRLLKNIINEYQIYYEKLRKTIVKKSFRKLFSIIVFKNLFPSEFIQLQADSSVINAILRKKQVLCKEKQQELENEINEIKEQIEENRRVAEESFIENEKELNALLFPISKAYMIDGKNETDFDSRIEFVDALLQGTGKIQYRESGYIRDKSFQDIQSYRQAMENTEEYKKQKHKIDKIRQFRNRDIKEMNHEIEKSNQLISELKGMNLKDFLDEYGFDFLWMQMPEDIRAKGIWSVPNNLELLKMLLTNGYVDESYGDFLSVFHEGGINESDKRYVRAVLDGDYLDINYRIDNESEVSSYLDEMNLKGPYARNVDMFCYYFREGNNRCQEAILDAVYMHDQYDLLMALLDKKFLYQLWIPKLITFNINILIELSEFHSEYAARMLVAGIYGGVHKDIKDACTEDDILTLLDSEDVVALFEQVSSHECVEPEELDENADVEAYNLLVEDRCERLEKAFTLLCDMKYKIVRFVPDMKNARDVSCRIYEKNLYELTMHNIKSILQSFYPADFDTYDDDILYEQICNTSQGKESFLYHYVIDNMPAFINCKMSSDAKWKEASEYMTEIINLAKDEQVEEVVKQMESLVERCGDISSFKRLNVIIEAEKLDYRPENVFDYYDLWSEAQGEHEDSSDEINNRFMTYIRNYPEKIMKKQAGQWASAYQAYDEKHSDDSCVNDIMNLISTDSKMEESKYLWILKSFHRVWRNSIPAQIPKERLPGLFREHIIKMSINGLEIARNSQVDILRQYILSDVDAYIKLMREEEIYDVRELCLLLNCDYESETINDYLMDATVEHMEDIVGYDASMTRNRAKALLLNHVADVDIADRIAVFTANISQFNKNDILEIFNTTAWPIPTKIFERKQVSIPATTQNKNLLEVLQKSQIISSYKEEGNKPLRYRIYPKKNIVFNR